MMYVCVNSKTDKSDLCWEVVIVLYLGGVTSRTVQAGKPPGCGLFLEMGSSSTGASTCIH